MALVHVVTGQRTCGAQTMPQGNSTVLVTDKLWAVEGDPDSHGGGGLIAGGAPTVEINDKRVIVQNDHAQPDEAGHADPAAADGVSTVQAGN